MERINKLEKVFLCMLGLLFFVGIWHAFPMLNVVNDEMYFVGGVLRAIESHTIIPAVNDVPYGTVTYVLNLVLSSVSLAVMLPFFGFHISELKLFLLESPWIMYLILRMLSACISVGMLYLVNRILKQEFSDVRVRLVLLTLLFTNLITLIVLHTGKVWVVSVFLVLTSFFFLYKALMTEESAGDRNKNIFLSILLAFLAFSNFPLNVFALINIPILIYYFRIDKSVLKLVLKYILVSIVFASLFVLINFSGIKNQIVSVFTQYHPVTDGLTYKLGFWSSFVSYALKLVLLFPLMLITLVFVIKTNIRNWKLFNISLSYFLSYFVLIVLVANWTGDSSSYLRYLFPLGFFLVFVVSSFNIQYNKILFAAGLCSVVFGLYTLYLLSVPTTYNRAYTWINTELSSQNVVIVNAVPELELIKNKKSSELVKAGACSTKCKNIVSADLHKDFIPLVIDANSGEYVTSKSQVVYYISDVKMTSKTLSLVSSFVNPSGRYHSVDYGMGSYFDTGLFKTYNLGKNIYIYKSNE